MSFEHVPISGLPARIVDKLPLQELYDAVNEINFSMFKYPNSSTQSAIYLRVISFWMMYRKAWYDLYNLNIYNCIQTGLRRFVTEVLNGHTAKRVNTYDALSRLYLLDDNDFPRSTSFALVCQEVLGIANYTATDHLLHENNKYLM